jgi:predicted Zn-dependent peptidase
MTGSVTVSTLPNGLRVATDTIPHVETVSVGVWVDAGTRDETPEINGVSHLLEHMAFKGTERRSARAIAEEIEAVGGHLNAYTGRESTAYYAKVLKEDLGLAVDILADILQHSRFDEDELARERDVVLQEIGQANDTPDDIIFDHFQETAFPDQPLGRPVLGRPEVVAGMTRDALTGYMGASYRGGRMVLAAAGNLQHEELVALAMQSFAGLGNGATPPRAAASYAGGDFREPRELEQVHLVLGFPGIPHRDPDFYAANLFSTMYGGGMSSRLFQEVRENRGLVYSIYSFASSYRDGGLFGVYAGTGAERLGELVAVVGEELRALAATADADEIARGRAQMKASLLMARESTGARLEQLANQLLIYGRPLLVEEIIAQIEALDRAALERVAARLASGPLTMAALGPIGKLPDYAAAAARFA